MNAAATADPHPIITAGNSHHPRKLTMLVHPFKIVAGLFAAGMLACAPAHAGFGTATASLTNIQYFLTDLDLTDNITPSITFSSQYGDGYVSFYSAGQGSSANFSGYETVSRVFPTGSVSATTAPTSLHSEAHASSVPASLSVDVDAWQNSSFTLSPSTRLSFSAQADVFVEEEGINQASASAFIRAEFETRINGVRGHEQFSMNLHSADGPRTQLLQGWLDTGAAVATGTLTAGTLVGFYHHAAVPPSPVPEPATYGMLAAGLLIIGSAARKKARKA